MCLNDSRLRYKFLHFLLKAGPAGGRLRRPSSAGNTSTGSQTGLSATIEPSPL
jgi:hypothetical protein